MFSSPIFTLTSVLSLILLIVTIVMQFMEMKAYGIL